MKETGPGIPATPSICRGFLIGFGFVLKMHHPLDDQLLESASNYVPIPPTDGVEGLLGAYPLVGCV